MSDLKTKFLNHELSSPLINVPIPLAWQPENLLKFAETPLGAITSKTVTLEAREGNESPRDHYENKYSINAIGLANDGIDEHLNYIKKVKSSMTSMPSTTDENKKPINFSISEFSVPKFADLFEKVQRSEDVDFIEANLSCPNTDHQMFCEDPKLIDELLSAFDQVLENLKNEGFSEIKPYGVKMPPESSTKKIEEAAEIFTKHQVSFLTATNTLGNSLIIDKHGTPAIKANGGFGGLSGAAIKPLSLSTVYRYYKAFQKLGPNKLGHKIQIIGCGGVDNGKDILDYLRAGADLVGIGTMIMKDGLEKIEKILQEFQELMSELNFQNLSEIPKLEL